MSQRTFIPVTKLVTATSARKWLHPLRPSKHSEGPTKLQFESEAAGCKQRVKYVFFEDLSGFLLYSSAPL